MKTCKKCGIEHNKNGQYCSRSCANSRTHSLETKAKIAKSVSSSMTDERRIEISKNNLNRTHSEETKAKIAKSVKESFTEETRERLRSANIGRSLSLEVKQKISRSCKDAGCGGHTSKRKLYFAKNNGEIIYLQSSYEIEFAKILEKLNIQWSRPKPFLWIDEHGIDHKYYPDFKIGDIYIDTKNDYLAIVDLPKINKVIQQNNIDLRIVTKDMICEEYIGSLV